MSNSLRLTEKDIVRFWTKVDKASEDECWSWFGGHFPAGYPAFYVQNQNTGAHRVSYYIANGKLTEGLVVRHLCNNTGCVNPRHLSEGTQKENIQDKIRSGRMPRGDSHPLSKNNPASEPIRKLLSEQKMGSKNPCSRLNPNSAEMRARWSAQRKGVPNPRRKVA